VQPTNQWAENFIVDDDDVDFIVNLLLEKETPLTITEISHILVAQRLESEAQALQDQYKDTKIYSPAEAYQVGEKVAFPAMSFSTATVTAVREGQNADYGDFSVMTVDFGDGSGREFASEFKQPHKLLWPEMTLMPTLFCGMRKIQLLMRWKPR
jgi:hypothetical protein